MDKFDSTRIADFILATIFISWVLPLWVIVIPVLLLTGEGEVFYRQPRVGKGGKLFDLLKFATMLKNSPNIGTGELTLHIDPRVLPVGHLAAQKQDQRTAAIVQCLAGPHEHCGAQAPDTALLWRLFRGGAARTDQDSPGPLRHRLHPVSG